MTSLSMVPLAEIASVVRGVSFSKAEVASQPSDHLLPILRAGNIQDILMLDDNLVYVPRDKVSERQMLRQGDIVICTSSGSSDVVGKTAFADDNWEGSFGAFCAGIRPDPQKCDPSFLFHYLRSPTFRAWTQKSSGANIKNIRKSELDQFKVPLPSLSQQRRVASILNCAHGVTRKRERAIKMAEDLLRSAFQSRFGDPVSNPKGWPLVTLDECAEEVRYGTSVKCTNDDRDGLPVLRIPNIVGGQLRWEDLKFANLSKSDVRRLHMRQGDIVFVRTNGNPEYIARCAVFDSDNEALFASYLIRARLTDNSRLLPRYLWMALSMPSYRRVLLRETRTTAGNYNISASGLKSLQVPAPPLDAQRDFDQFYGRLSESIAKMTESLTETQMLRSSLSQSAFRGEL